MKTDDLNDLLASGEGAVPSHAAARRYAIALGAGALGAAPLIAALLGARPDLARAALLPMFWVKLAFAGSLAAAGVMAVLRLSRPGARLDRVPGALAAPVLAMWVLALIELARADAAKRAELFFGDTWNSCPFLIATLSAPVFVALLWAMKGLAPTRLRLAGRARGCLPEPSARSSTRCTARKWRRPSWGSGICSGC